MDVGLVPVPDQSAALGFVCVQLPGRQSQLVHQADEDNTRTQICSLCVMSRCR